MTSVLLILGVIVTLLERFLSLNWVPFYFCCGIPIFWKKIPLSVPEQWDATVAQIQSRFRVNQPPYEFRQLSKTDFAFREKWFVRRGESRIRYPPVIHGLLHKHSGEDILSIVGFLNWHSLVFFLLILAFALEENSAAWAVVFLVLLINGSVLWYQLGIYDEVIRAISKHQTLRNQPKVE